MKYLGFLMRLLIKNPQLPNKFGVGASNFMATRRKLISLKEKKIVFQKTGGRCHICAKRLKFDAKSGEIGRWQVDHILPKKRGGKDSLNNYLPICVKCNRLRWCFGPRTIKKHLNMGVIACRLVKNKTHLGKELHKIHLQNRLANKKRRKIKK